MMQVYRQQFNPIFKTILKQSSYYGVLLLSADEFMSWSFLYKDVRYNGYLV